MPRRSARLTVRTATVDLAAGAAQADVEDALQAAQDPAPPSVDPLSGASPAHEASAATEAPDEDAAALAAAEDAAAAAAASAVTAAAVAAAAEASAAREAALSAEVLAREVERRRNFAIISHPDAGKTTLTERLLLYGGAIHEAGEVKARASKRHATSDWMELERSRGISITSTAMTFAYSTFQLNLLDTPGHSDFSEDTYRTLAAADNAVMLVDAAKGIEPQTRKLFEVARMRGLPIFTFVNKLDRPALNGFEIIEQLEREFGLSAYPITWPIGSGDRFCGLYHRPSHSVHLYIKNTKGKAAECRVVPFDDAALPGLVDPELWAQLQEDVELMQVLSDELSPDDVVNGRVTPMFFGSAFQTIGVDLFLAEFVKWAARPAAARATGNAAALAPHAAGGGAVAAAAAAVGAAARAGAVPPPASSSPASSKGGGGGGSGSGGGGGGGGGGSTGSAASEGLVLPTSPHFSGIVFKLQANMDPKHRDKVAFVRVVSGKFEKGMKVKVARSGRVVSLSRPQTMFARDRSTVQEGFAGDVIGLTNPGAFAIGDTLYAGPEVAFPPIPSFSPELFAYLRCAPNQRKAFTKGVAGLLGEGAVQVLYSRDEYVVDPILAAVGQLQFEVVQYRMKDEYGVDTTLEPLSYSLARWVVGGWACVEAAGRLFNTQVTKDMWGRPVLLFRNEYSFNAVLGDAGEALGELSPYALPPSI